MSGSDTKQAEEIVTGLVGKIINTDTADVRQALRDKPDMGRLIGRAAVWHRRQIRRVSLNQQPIGRDARGHLAQGLGIAKGNDAGKRDVKIEIKRRPCHFSALCKTVQDTTHLVRPLVAQQTNRVIGGLAGVNNKRPACSPGSGNMLPELLVLDFDGALSPVIIESGFANRHDSFARGQPDKIVKKCRHSGPFVGMNAHRTQDTSVPAGERRYRWCVVKSDTDAQHVTHVLQNRARHGPIGIGPQRIHMEVTMRIDVGHGLHRMGSPVRLQLSD